MAIQYYMRGYDAILDTDVDWVVNDTPDTSGTYSGSVNPLTNIRVNRTVQSPVDSLIKPSIPSFVNNQIPSINQNFLYLNSYDWVYPGYPNLTPPVISIPPPAANYGIAVMRGAATLPTPNNYASLYWNESNNQWTFNVLDSGTFNPTGSVSLAVGSPTPTTGIIRIPNNQFITGLDSTGFVDVPIIKVNDYVNNRIEIGNSGYGVYVPGQLIADQYLALTNFSNGTAIVASSGLIRAPNNTVALAFANNASIAILDAISSTATDQIVIGEDVNNSGVIYKVGSLAGSHRFDINGDAKFAISDTQLSFDINFYSPVITQDIQNFAGNGQPLTLKAQSSSALGSSGGDLILASGSGVVSDGIIELKINTTTKIEVGSATTLLYNTALAFDSSIGNVSISQNQINLSAPASDFTISAQNNIAMFGDGGNLILSSGSSNFANNGNLLLQVGGVTYGTIGTNNCDFDFPSNAGIYDFSINTNSRLNIADAATTLDTDALGLYTFSVNTNPRLSIQDSLITFDTAASGICSFYISSSLVAQIVTDKFETSAGRRRHITDVDDNGGLTLSYNIQEDDDIISVTSIVGIFTINLPSSPTTGDTYTIKDSGGNAGTFTITVDAGLSTIDGVATFPLNVNYQSLDVIYNGTEWSII